MTAPSQPRSALGGSSAIPSDRRLLLAKFSARGSGPGGIGHPNLDRIGMALASERAPTGAKLR